MDWSNFVPNVVGDALVAIGAGAFVALVFNRKLERIKSELTLDTEIRREVARLRVKTLMAMASVVETIAGSFADPNEPGATDQHDAQDAYAELMRDISVLVTDSAALEVEALLKEVGPNMHWADHQERLRKFVRAQLLVELQR